MSPSLIRRYRWFRKAGVGGVVGRDAARCLDLARAEEYASENGWEFSWEEDLDGRWDAQEYMDDYGIEIERVESCVLRDANGRVLTCLCGIWDASQDYQRIVEAELASEAMYDEWKHDSANVLSL